MNLSCGTCGKLIISDDDLQNHQTPEPALVVSQVLAPKRGVTVMNQCLYHISHLLPSPEVDHDALYDTL